MAFRGRGRGRGGFGGGFGFRIAKQEPFELFPEIKDNILGSAKDVTERKNLAKWSVRLEKFWNSSPYYIGDEGGDDSKKTKSMDIERFSDKNSSRAKRRAPLSHYITIDPAYIPAELAKGERTGKHAAKRVRWNQDQDFQKFELFEELEKKSKGQGQGQDEEKAANEGEDDEEQDENAEEDEEEGGDDYEQNIDFDDDEDDFNLADDNDDEGTF